MSSFVDSTCGPFLPRRGEQTAASGGESANHIAVLARYDSTQPYSRAHTISAGHPAAMWFLCIHLCMFSPCVNAQLNFGVGVYMFSPILTRRAEPSWPQRGLNALDTPGPSRACS